MEKQAEVSRVICDFLAGDANPETLMPSRRSDNAGISSS
jgi:hypothetical protein